MRHEEQHSEKIACNVKVLDPGSAAEFESETFRLLTLTTEASDSKSIIGKRDVLSDVVRNFLFT